MSPHHHLKETLSFLANNLEPDRQLFICRELTKKFKELVSLQAIDIAR
ncbi:hypothetical protein [Polynucleobacter necessarius]|nr:hypothetical protein [Polynucleobacter necessarius]